MSYKQFSANQDAASDNKPAESPKVAPPANKSDMTPAAAPAEVKAPAKS